MSVRPAWFYPKPIAPTAADRPPAQCVDVGRPPQHLITASVMGRFLLRLFASKRAEGCRPIFPCGACIHIEAVDLLISIDDFAAMYLMPAVSFMFDQTLRTQPPDSQWYITASSSFDDLGVSVLLHCNNALHIRFDVARRKTIVAHDAAAVAHDIAALEEMYGLEPTE
jgi:hypothetical protein